MSAIKEIGFWALFAVLAVIAVPIAILARMLMRTLEWLGLDRR